MTFAAIIVIEKLINGNDTRRMLLIVTDKAQEVVKGVIEKIERVVTIAEVRDG